jgi:3-deoxy-manno-octulosonate cytidylyltransferase (CMP-KDO synthetase)
MKIVGIIPARYASTRFPGKPLVPIAGKPLLQHVVEQCRKAGTLSEVIVATDDERIAEVARGFCQVQMTRADHPSGTDRVAEVAARCDCQAVVNVQGDEPLIDPTVIDAVANALGESELSTAATPIADLAALNNPAVVKVVTDRTGHALYFSRSPVPHVRDDPDRSVWPPAGGPFLRHLGIYGYRREALLKLVQWPVSALEQAEKLEQLRALENGMRIAVVRVQDEGIGVDTPEDVARVEAILAGSH